MPRYSEHRLLAASCALAVAMLTAPSPALAVDINAKPLAELRLRYENVDQEGFSRTADAITLRARVGVQLEARRWTLLAEGETTVPIVERYDNGLDGRIAYPMIADPENLELNRLQLQHTLDPATTITLGRQRIALEDQRLVGSAYWRQNEQTFDALRIEHHNTTGVQLDLSYAWSIRTLWGVEGAGARPQAISGNNLFAMASAPTPVGRLGLFAILVDENEAAVQNYQLSSQTYGVRINGTHAISDTVKTSYAFSYARQQDLRHNPNNYTASYALAEVGLLVSKLSLGAGLERLGAGTGAPFTSFQTPLARLARSRGWADPFPVTPPKGLKDYSLRAGRSWAGLMGFDTVGAAVVHHNYDSDRGGLHYGGEWDAQLSAVRGPWKLTAQVARYRANQLGNDIRKLWLQLEWAY